MKSFKKHHFITLIFSIIICVSIFISCGGGSSGGDNNNTIVKIGYTGQQLAKEETIGATGGTIEITDVSSPLNGLKIEVPKGATNEEITFTISYADVSGVTGVPDTAKAASKMIFIETDGSDNWDQYKLFNESVVVTLPYTDGGTDDEPTMFYSYDDSNGYLDATGAIYHDETNKTITFITGTFSTFVAFKLQLALSEILGQNFTTDSNFRPDANGWYITNYGSYLENGGICYGMASYAKWYYTLVTGLNLDSPLYEKYQNDTTEWRDDSTAIELATRAHIAETNRWDAINNAVISNNDVLNNQWVNPSSKLVGISIVHGIYVTSLPQILAIYEQRGLDRVGSHAILAYRYTNGTFDIYDPNFPATNPGDVNRQIGFTLANGFVLPYNSGADAANPGAFNYNIIVHTSLKMAASNSMFLGLYNMAEDDFKSTSVFPTITITGCKGWDIAARTAGPDCIEETNSDGEHMYVTDYPHFKLYATILGGYSQGGPATDPVAERQDRVIDRTQIYLSDRAFWAPVDNQLDAGTGQIMNLVGDAGVVLPLYQGENDLVLLTTAANGLSEWAGYKKEIIKSNASDAALMIGLVWDLNNCDVNLHVVEPAVRGGPGRHIYYGNTGDPGDTSISPYLEFNNETGYGPEIYRAEEGMTTLSEDSSKANPNNLYGTYRVRAQYFDDYHAGGDRTVTGTIIWRYLAYKNESSGIEYWTTGSQKFIINQASSSDATNFDSTGASWSDVVEIEYPEPDADDWGVLPPDVMLP